jgi:hypothetical protein
MRAFAVGISLLVSVMAAKAQTYSGNDLSTHCATDMPFVAGYIGGFTDKAIVDEVTVSLISVGEVQKIDGNNEHAYMMTKSQAALAMRGYCVPDGATVHQAADLYCKYLSDNPAQRQLTAVGLLDLALKAGWPCRWSHQRFGHSGRRRLDDNSRGKEPEPLLDTNDRRGIPDASGGRG